MIKRVPDGIEGRSLAPNRLLVIILSAVLLFTGAVVIVSTDRQVSTLSTEGPQGVVQAFIRAMNAGQSEKAAIFLSSGSKCTLADLDRSFVAPDMRVYLLTTQMSEERASVRIKVETSSGGLLTDSYTENHTLRLAKISGKWHLVGIPWPLYDCGVNQK